MAHVIDYVELAVDDLGRAKAFYADALGWAFNDYGPDYAGIKDPSNPDQEFGGLNPTSLPPGAKASWPSFARTMPTPRGRASSPRGVGSRSTFTSTPADGGSRSPTRRETYSASTSRPNRPAPGYSSAFASAASIAAARSTAATPRGSLPLGQ